MKYFDNDCLETLPNDHCYPFFEVLTLKNFDNDCFETLFFRLSRKIVS